MVHQDSIGIEMLKLGFTGVPKTICSKFCKERWSSYVVTQLVSHKLDLDALTKALMKHSCNNLFTYRRIRTRIFPICDQVIKFINFTESLVQAKH